MQYREAEKTAREINENLTALSFNNRSLAAVIHEEGTCLYYRNAFIQEHQNYIFIFTEHHGFHVYDKEDLIDWGTYIREMKK